RTHLARMIRSLPSLSATVSARPYTLTFALSDKTQSVPAPTFSSADGTDTAGLKLGAGARTFLPAATSDGNGDSDAEPIANDSPSPGREDEDENEDEEEAEQEGSWEGEGPSALAGCCGLES